LPGGHAHDSDSEGSAAHHTPHTPTYIMALPKSMRILAVITVGIFFYLCLLILQAPAAVEPPSSGSGLKMDKMLKDPNLERMLCCNH
jgi:hypothetical protein